mmetsp:Transcript_25366/g.31760  ORF Transcript_25366/g.31760 Transcript_25366/m.31760 type:complete len:90 (-) Transcript_25366:373-642(-)
MPSSSLKELGCPPSQLLSKPKLVPSWAATLFSGVSEGENALTFFDAADNATACSFRGDSAQILLLAESRDGLSALPLKGYNFWCFSLPL